MLSAHRGHRVWGNDGSRGHRGAAARAAVGAPRSRDRPGSVRLDGEEETGRLFLMARLELVMAASPATAQPVADLLAAERKKDLLRFLTCGSVDDGKSTLIGRLLYDSKLVYDDQLAGLVSDSKRTGTTGGGPVFAPATDV